MYSYKVGFQYDVAQDGGAISTITLGQITGPCLLVFSSLRVITAFASGLGTGRLTLQDGAGNAVSANLRINTNDLEAGDVHFFDARVAASGLQINTTTNLNVAVTTDAFTAGLLKGYIQCIAMGS